MSTMSLAHYLSQREPEFMPTVLLEKDEVQIGFTMPYSYDMNGKPTYITQVFLMGSIHYCYVIVENGTTLRTTDEHGNPKGYSCFHLKEPINQKQIFEQQQRHAQESLKQMGYE